jgi:hypothetical protein
MPLSLHFRVGQDEPSFRAEDEGRTDGAQRGPAVELLLTPRAQSLQHARFGVGQKRIAQIQLFRKRPMGFDRIFADSRNMKSSSVECVSEFTELACFGSSAGGIILRVDEEHQAVGSDQIGKLSCLPVLIRQMTLRV